MRCLWGGIASPDGAQLHSAVYLSVFRVCLGMAAFQGTRTIGIPFVYVYNALVRWGGEDDIGSCKARANDEDGTIGGFNICALGLRSVQFRSLEEGEKNWRWWNGVREDTRCKDEVATQDNKYISSFTTLNLDGEARWIPSDAFYVYARVDGGRYSDRFRVRCVVRGYISSGGTYELWWMPLV